jgi:NAD+ synthetase
MKIALIQHDPIPGDVRGNCEQLQGLIGGAAKQGATIILCPEMSTTGYLIRDLIYRRTLLETNLRHLNDFASYTTYLNGVTLILGYVDYNHSGTGKPFRNMAAVMRDGTVVATYQKRLLPFYDVFDEGRYFEPGHELCVVTIDGMRFGLLICEDGWSADKGETSNYYDSNPVDEYKALGIHNFLWLNASPYVRHKIDKRMEIARKLSRDGVVAYCNMIGGQDSLVFDGLSFVYSHGEMRGWAKDQTEPSFVVVDPRHDHAGDDIPTDDFRRMIVMGTRDYGYKCGFTDIVVPSSGGIDSAVVISIACEAFGPEHVAGIRLPTKNSSQGSLDDALALHQNWGCKDFVVGIDHEPLLAKMDEAFGFDPQNAPVAAENIQPRLRALTAMHYSNVTGALLLTTGNKTELATGFNTYGGDSVGGFDPLVDCYKHEVYQLAEMYEQIPKAIIHKPPSAELKPGQVDEDILLPYQVLDLIVEAYIEDHVTIYEDFMKWGSAVCDVSKVDYQRMVSRIDFAEWKRHQMGPGPKVHRVAIGIGRRLPIAKR